MLIPLKIWQFIVSRLLEKSTYAGIFTILTALNIIPIPEDHQQAILVIVGVILTLVHERNK